MKKIYFFALACILISCNNITLSDYEKKIIEHRKTANKEFLADGSPLLDEDKKNFAGLNYFSPDSNYAFWSNYSKFKRPDTVEMPTTTERIIFMVNEGKLKFNLKDTNCTLLVFYDVENFEKTGKKEYFIPMGDETSGKTTYGGGRYLEVDSLNATGDLMWLDFNYLYNPYCAYNHNYSCPIPPKENILPVHIAAGEKVFY